MGNQKVQHNKNKTLGIALVGLGNYSEYYLAPALQKTKFCQLRGLVSGSAFKQGQWIEKFDIPIKNIYNYENFDEIVGNSAIDIVYIALPNSMHAEFTIRAAKAGKHVICEKPMAISADQCRAMIKACQDAAVRLTIGYRLHCEPYNKKMTWLGQKEILGPIEHLEAGYGIRMEDANQWRLKKNMSGGGSLMDMGIYTIQAARYITGMEPIRVLAREEKKDPIKFKEVEEIVYFKLEFLGGITADCLCSYSSQIDFIHVESEFGWFELDPAFHCIGISGQTNKGKMYHPQTNQQALQMDSFAYSILKNIKYTITGEDGLKDIQIIEALYESLATGRKIETPHFAKLSLNKLMVID